MKKHFILKKLGMLALCTCLASTTSTSALTALAGEENEPQISWQDGTYEASGIGYGGTVTLSVTIKDGKITEINEVSKKETALYWNAAKTLFTSIIEQQTPEVDVVTGATKSSDAIKQAVRKALNKASGIDYSEPDASIFASGSGAVSDPFIISTEEQFRNFAASVSGVLDYSGYTIQLNKDMNISGSDWNPIGGDSVSFNGTFDGNGHKIIGLTEGNTSEAKEFSLGVCGLFGKLGANAVIKNTNLTKVYMNVSCPGQIDIGAFAGTTTGTGDGRCGTIIDGCNADGEIIVKNKSGNIWAGGFIGMQFRGAILNSGSDVNVSATEIRGTQEGATTEEFWVEVGGISGLNFWALIANSHSSGNVYAKYYDENTENHDLDTTYASVGGLSGLDYGTEVNNYTTGNVEAGVPTNYIGVIDGMAETAADVQNNWYSTEVTLKNGDTTKKAGADNLTPVPDGDTPTLADNNGFSTKKFSALATALNTKKSSLPMDISQYGVTSDNLNGWTYSVVQDKAVLKNSQNPLETVSIRKCKISGVKDLVYTGKALTQNIKVTYEGRDARFNLTYDNNKSIGKHSVTVTGTDEFTGSKTFSYNIVPAQVSISKAKSSGKNVSITYKKITGATSYQISLRKGSGNWKNYTTTKTSKTFKLSNPKQYSVRVRAFKTVNGKKYYGTWSKTSKVK